MSTLQERKKNRCQEISVETTGNNIYSTRNVEERKEEFSRLIVGIQKSLSMFTQVRHLFLDRDSSECTHLSIFIYKSKQRKYSLLKKS